jgi:dihydrofolate reductase
MRKIIVSEFMTVNGLISDPGDTMDWVKEMFNEEMLREVSSQQSRVDTLLLGRLTYQIMESYWLNASPETEDAKMISYMNNTAKIVFSKTLTDLQWNNSTLVRKIDATEIRQWQKQRGKDLAIIGSASIAQAFINLGLVDEYQFLIHPLMLAKGKPLFKNIKERHALKPIKTETYKNGVICLYYEPSGRH